MLRMLPVLNRSGISFSVWIVTPKLYGDDWVSSKIVCERARPPATGSFDAVAVTMSPSPCPKSVCTLVCRCS
jgi:hypothetical protein